MFGVKFVIGSLPDLLEWVWRQVYSTDIKPETHTGKLNTYMTSGWRIWLFPEWWLHTYEDKKIWHYYPPEHWVNKAGFWLSIGIDLIMLAFII